MKRFKFHLLVAVLLALVASTAIHARLRDAITDARFHLIKRPASGQIALVEIDSRSIDGFGVWPWPRTLHAQIIDSLEKIDVTDIAFDVDFSAASTPEADAALAEALRRAGGSVILPAFRQRMASQGSSHALHVNRPIPLFAGLAWLGLVNVAPDRDGVIRRYDYGNLIEGTFVPSLGALLSGTHNQKAQPFLIDFGISTVSVPRVSFIDVIRADPATMAAIAGKKVIISGTAIELGDRFNVPNSHIIPGSMIQLLGAESILQGRTLSVSNVPAAFLGAALVMLLSLLVWERTGRIRTRLAGLALIAVTAESLAIAVQSFMPVVIDTSLMLVAIAAYIIAVGVDELDLSRVLRSIAERRFSHIAVALGDGLVCTDNLGRINFWNPAANAIFGYETDEVMGKNFSILLSGGADTDEAPDFEALSAQARGNDEAGPAILELAGKRKTGERFDLECSLSAWAATDGTHYGAVLRDISRRKQQQLRIRYLAEFDALTALPNRNSLIAHLEKVFKADGAEAPQGGLMLVGIKHFDHINDLYGHSLGDRLLKDLTVRLTTTAGSTCYTARLGNDEFALFVSDTDEVAVLDLGQKLLAAVHAEDFGTDGHQFRLTVAVGVALAAGTASAEELLGNAHFALSTARASNVAAPVPYTSQMRQAIERRGALETELRLALVRSEFELFFQPQVDLLTGDLIGAEALIRWHHPLRGYVAPGEFLSVVNTTTLSEGVADWVLQAACRQGAAWQKAGHPVRIGVNMAQSQFTSGDIVSDVARLLDETGLAPSLLELEVTEDIVLDRIEQTQTMLAAIRALGVHTAYDDFGTGYGSLTYLKAFPLDKIKIDQTFVKGIRQGADDAAIVASTIVLSRALGLSVIAEGVEDRLTADLLIAMGCRQAQGYFFGKPMPASEFEMRFLSSGLAISHIG